MAARYPHKVEVLGSTPSRATKNPKKEPHMDFGKALEHLKKGGKVARHGWNGKGLWLELQVPDAHSKMTLPYVYLNYPAKLSQSYNGDRVPWLASQTDMLSDDWHEVE